MRLRPYQLLAVDGIFAKWQKVPSTLVVMPTGTGKTVVFSDVVHRAMRELRWDGLWMVIAHREELVRQAADKLEAAGITTQIEMADQKAEMSVLRRPECIVASIQTLTRRGLRFKPHEFAGVIIDEAHHYTSPSWRAYIEHLKQNADLKILAVTATPDRTDQHALGKVFDSVAYEMGIKDAIEGGWLVPVRQLPIQVTGLDYSGCRTTAGDLNGRDLADCMSSEKVIQEIAGSVVDRAGGRKTIIFAPPGFKKDGEGDPFRVSERMNEIINRFKPGCSALISDKTEKDMRRQILKDFAEKRLQFLVNVGVLTEGFDSPDLELIIMARPTKSRALYAQMIGRGTRPLPGVVDGPATAEARKAAIAASAKPYLEVLDYVGVCGKHKLVTAADILGGIEPPEVVDLANRIIKSKGGRPSDVQAAIEEAKLTIADKKRKEEAEAKRRAAVKAKVTYKVGAAIDPFNVLDIAPDRHISTVRSEPRSTKQAAQLERFGVMNHQNLSRREACKIIGELIERRRAGLCTFKQTALLQRHGVPTAGMTFERAKVLIDGILNRRNRPAPVGAHMPEPEPVA